MSELPVPIDSGAQSVLNQSTGARPDGRRTHVLIVDDQAGVRAICAAFCDLFDHTTQTAKSAAPGPPPVAASPNPGNAPVVVATKSS